MPAKILMVIFSYHLCNVHEFQHPSLRAREMNQRSAFSVHMLFRIHLLFQDPVSTTMDMRLKLVRLRIMQDSFTLMHPVNASRWKS